MSGLEALGRLVGAWEVEASHPMLEDAVRGRIEVEWLEGGGVLAPPVGERPP